MRDKTLFGRTANHDGTKSLRVGALLSSAMLALALLSGCQGGAGTVANPGSNDGNTLISYSGPPAQSNLIQNFQLELWPHLVENCGDCHAQGGQTPTFARTDDINLAYNAAITVTNMSSPPDSRLVSKVGSGHNCWLPNNFECSDVMTRWIENWLGDMALDGRAIELEAPADPDAFPGSSKPFPDTASTVGTNGTSFANTVHPILTANCASCHVESPPAPQLPIAPFFASNDINSSYEAAKPKMDLDIPANSRFVKRMQEGHNCYDPNPADNRDICEKAEENMQQAIEAFANGIDSITPVIGNNQTVSGAVTLADATVASGGNRYENDLIALYEFKAGSGPDITEVSGAGTPINLRLFGAEGSDYQWVGGYGVEFMSDNAKAQDISSNSGRLQQAISTSGEYSIEAWVIPGNVTQEDAHIISYSSNETEGNFTLGQRMYNYEFMHRSSTTENNPDDATSTPNADEVLQSSLQHVVTTFDPVEGRRIYVNGEVTNAVDPAIPGTLADWDGVISPMLLGNSVAGDRPWKGVIRLAAIHERAMEHQQIVQNFEAGVGEKYFMLFGISHINPAIIPDGSFIVFEFSQFDNYGYLFNKPTYVNLNDPNTVPGFTLSGMRIGVNGNLPLDGQAFSNINVTLGSNYTPEEGEVLSNLGTIIAVEKDIDQDEFFLVFDEIAGISNAYQEPPVTAPTPVEPPQVADMGVRVFAEINASMSEMTGVPVTNSAVASVYESYEQQLPTVENLDSFLGSHQMAIAQLALTYCDELVDGSSGNAKTPAEYFPGFDFSQPATTAFDTAAKRNAILDPLLAAAMNIDSFNGNLTSQPVEGTLTDGGSGIINGDGIRGVLGSTEPQTLVSTDDFDGLITHMLNQCGRVAGPNGDDPPPYTGSPCTETERTTEIVKATCAAAIGGAVMLIQ